MKRLAPGLSAAVAPFSFLRLRAITSSRRVDHTFTNRHNGQVLYQLGRFTNLRQFGGGNRLAEALVGKTRNSDAIAYLDNYVISAKVVAETRFQFSRLSPAVVATGGETPPVVLIRINDPLKLVTGTLVAGSSSSGATDRREDRFQFQAVFSYISGNHSLKFGGDIQRIKSTFIDLEDASGTWDFDSAGDFLANSPSRFRQNFLTTSTQRNTYFGVFAQDEWRIKPNFTMSYGSLRKPSFMTCIILAARRHCFDPFKTGKTVIRAGAESTTARYRTIDDFTLGAQTVF